MTTESPTRPHSVLFLCTGNSARSQIAEALMNKKARGKFIASSAGSRPAACVNPYAIRTLLEIGIDWAGHAPRSMDAILDQTFDIVITVCDDAQEACPVFPGQPRRLHWGMPDPAGATGTSDDKALAFASARDLLARKIDELLAELPTAAPAGKFSE
jgi:arsenate reductase